MLFLCTGNSCRSQMAEGWARHLRGDAIEPYSAGIRKHGLNPLAVRAMAEAGVDISGQTSKTVEELGGAQFDLVVTVCGHANEHCPIFPGKAKVIHVGFDDPPKLAEGAASAEEAMVHYRRVCDEIRDFVARMEVGENPRTVEQSRKPAVLFLCTHNAARSQMAEGVLRHLAGDRFRVLSAGLEPTALHPLAVEVMAEIGIDISAQKSKGISAILGRDTITHAFFVCAKAESQCPRIYPFALQAHSWPFEDPAAADGPEEFRRQKFREVRDQISARIGAWLEAGAGARPSGATSCCD